MPLATSFKEHYSRRDVGGEGNINVKAFNVAMDIETNNIDAIKAFDNVDGIIITVGLPNKVKIIHGLKNFGNSFSRPKSKICGHIGLNEFAFVGTIDFVDALSLIQFDTPTRAEFEQSNTVSALKALKSPDVSTGWAYEGIKVFFPIPFVQRALIRSGSTCPLELIFAAREGYTEFMDEVQEGDIIVDEINSHMEILESFLWGIHRGLIEGIRFDPDPDDIELRSFSLEYHSKRLSGSIGINPVSNEENTRGTTHARSGEVVVGGRGNLEILTSALTRAIEDQGASAEILEKMHQHAVEKAIEKKEKAEKWHQATKRLVLFASSRDGTMPELNIPNSYRNLINSSTLGNAENELIAQMRELGHEEVEWPPALTNSLRNGNFLYDSMGSPSNFSIFMLKVKDPTNLNEQHSRGMKLHILEQGKDNNKSILEIVEKGKHKISIPTTVEDLLIVTNSFSGLASILFGPKSSLPIALKHLYHEMETNKLLLKGKVKVEPSLVAKVMFSVDSRTQIWFSYLRRAKDREDVNDEIINFSSIINEVVLDQFRVVLPPNFAMDKVKEDEETLIPISKKPKKNKEGKAPKDGDSRMDVNKDVPKEFKLLEGENYKKRFGHGNVEHRPAWDENCSMCPRWWTHGTCYKDCRNAASHVPSSELPQDKKKAFIEFLEIARRK